MQVSCKPPQNTFPYVHKNHSRNTSSVIASSEKQPNQTFAFEESSELIAQNIFQETPQTPQFNYKARQINVSYPSVGESMQSIDISNEARKSKAQFPNFEELPSLKMENVFSSVDSFDDMLGSLATDYSTKLRASLENYTLTLSTDDQYFKRESIEILEIIHEENSNPTQKEEDINNSCQLQNSYQLQRISTNLKILKSVLLIQR